MTKKILWHTFRIGCWLFFWAAIIYSAWLLPRVVAGLIERGTEHPKFWSRLFVTIVVGSGLVVGVIAMVHVTKLEVVALLDRFREKSDGQDKGQ